MAQIRLLVVEDDRTSAAFLERMLRTAGYDVAVAGSGPEALAILGAGTEFSAVLLDRRLPGMDGLEVLERMKEIQELQDIPVILQTALGSAEEVREGLQAGAFYYLQKPLDTKLVLQVVETALAEQLERRETLTELEGVRSAMGQVRRGLFRYQTLAQCHDLCSLLAKACPDPRRVVLGLSELMINALEHGNLGITYEEKTALVEARTWRAEVIRRQALPEHRDKWVEVALVKGAGRIRFRITDMGKGFRWESFQELDPARLFDNHGRGILLAKWEAFDRIQYQGRGNVVLAEVATG